MSTDDEMLRSHLRTWNGFARMFFLVGAAVALLLAVLGLVFYG